MEATGYMARLMKTNIKSKYKNSKKTILQIRVQQKILFQPKIKKIVNHVIIITLISQRINVLTARNFFLMIKTQEIVFSLQVIVLIHNIGMESIVLNVIVQDNSIIILKFAIVPQTINQMRKLETVYQLETT